jgi:hypothetical protein
MEAPSKAVEEKFDYTKLNDVILPQAEGFGPRHFSIKFNTDLSCYTLKDLGEGSGTFIKLAN